MAHLIVQAPPTSAQTVSSASGAVVTLTYGQTQGVAAGMTGRLCTEEEVGGKKIEVCGAKFEITAVRETSATGKITGGDPGEVAKGHRALFDQKLAAPAAPSPSASSASVAPRATSAGDLLARGNRLFDVKDWEGAAAAFGELIARYPDHPDADYARKLLKASEERSAAASAEAAAATRREATSAAVSDLVARAERLLVAEQWAEAKVLAEQALALDPAQGRARTVRTRAVQKLTPPPAPPEPEREVLLVINAELKKTLMANHAASWKCAVFDDNGMNICETDFMESSGYKEISATRECRIPGRRIEGGVHCAQFHWDYGKWNQEGMSEKASVVIEGDRRSSSRVRVKFRTARFCCSPVIEELAVE